MTREEAIKRLKSDIYKYSDFTENPNENEFWTAFDMAIKALEQEPCEDDIHTEREQAYMKGYEDASKKYRTEPCEDVTDTNVGDLISRQAAIDALAKFVPYAICDELTESYTNGLMDAYNLVCQLPSVTPERSKNPERNRPESIKYCENCDHVEMCSWYPTDGCVWLKTDRYNAGYNAAKREIALSGEYERIYQRGFEAGRKSEWTAVADKAESEDKYV